MKILTKEEEAKHYSQTVKGGAVGGLGGLLVGGVGLYAATLRYPVFRHMSLQLRAFLLTSSTTFGAIVTADHFSSVYEKSRQPNQDYRDPSARARAAKLEAEGSFERMKQWGKENKYKIVGGSWIVSIIVALSLAGRNPYLSTQQKLVQARVYAQGLTIAVMVATAVLEIGEQRREEGRWETRKIVDPKDPEHKRVVEEKYWEGGEEGKKEPDGISEKRGQKHYEGEDQWKDMVEVEENRLKRREQAAHERQAAKHKKQKEHDHKEHMDEKNEGGDGEEHKGKKEEGEKEEKKKKKETGGKGKGKES